MREKLSMDFAWRFHLDDIDRPVPNNMMYYYLHTKAERARGPAAPSKEEVLLTEIRDLLKEQTDKK